MSNSNLRLQSKEDARKLARLIYRSYKESLSGNIKT